MPNPSELQRQHEEFVEQRTKSWQQFADSREKAMSYHDKCNLLRDKIRVLKNKRLAKGPKEELLGDIRRLEKELGFNLGNYNRSDFASSVRG